MSQFSFACFDCGARAFLIRGSCRWCEPELHAEHERRMAALREVTDAYRRETGLEPLADRDAFEAWTIKKCHI